jgi:hypothetical protein
MKQSPSWEANTSSASQEIPHILWNPKVHYHIQNSSPHVPILNQMIQSARPSHFPTIHFNIVLHLRLGLSNCLLPSGFPTKTMHAPLLSPFVLLALPISVFLTWWPKWYVVRNTEHKAPCYVVFSNPLFPRPVVSNTLLSTLFSNNLSQCSFPKVSDQVSHPHKTTGTITTRYRFTRNEGFYGGSVSPVCLSEFKQNGISR